MRKDHDLRDLLKGYAFLAPVCALLLAFVFLPVAGTLLDSLHRNVTFLPRRFIGLGNYRSMGSDPGFWQSLRFTGLFTLVSVPLELALGLAFALLLEHPTSARGFLRAGVLLPWAIPAAVSGRIFELIYNVQYGLANALVTGIGLSEGPVHWLGTSAGAFLALVAADAWKTTPFVAILLLAGLSAIPEDLYRQAEVDRAGPLQRFFRVTLPLLRPVLVVALLFRTIDSLRVFDLVFVLTGGGPGGSTTSLSMYGYRFFVGGDFGYGSAVSVVLFVLAFLFSLLYLRASRFGREIT